MLPLKLTGESGYVYYFSTYSLNGDFYKISCVYAITTNYGLKHTIHYIGQTDDLQERLKNHHKLAECVALGANCICIHLESEEYSRLQRERDLIAYYKPPLNELLKRVYW